MRIVLLTLMAFLMQPIPSFAKCQQAEICEMIKKLDHFSILNACPDAGPMLKECRKVNVSVLEQLAEPNFVDNGDGTIAEGMKIVLVSHIEGIHVVNKETDPAAPDSGVASNNDTGTQLVSTQYYPSLASGADDVSAVDVLAGAGFLEDTEQLVICEHEMDCDERLLEVTY